MIKIELKPEEYFSKNSKIQKIIPGKHYLCSLKITGYFGKPNCGYFGVIYLDQNNLETDRKIKWLNDFSSNEKTLELAFTGTTNKILFIYRINSETDYTSHSCYEFTSIDEITLSEINEGELVHYSSIDSLYLERLDELLPDEENHLEKNLVWVFGFARSGTSWLGLQLLSHNTNFINELHIDKHLGIREEFIIDKFVRRYDHMKNIPSYFFSEKFKNTWMFYLRKLILNRIYAEVPDYSKNIILKEPGGGLGSFDIISQCLPNSKSIIVFRDGRDVIDSFMDARQKDGFMSHFGETPVTFENRCDYIKYHSEIWTNYTNKLLENINLSHKKIYSIKYEDLLKNTFEELTKLYKFLDIDISSEEIQKIIEKYDFNKISKDQKGRGKFYRSATPGKWKEHFTDEEIKIMNRIMNDPLVKLNYI